MFVCRVILLSIRHAIVYTHLILKDKLKNIPKYNEYKTLFDTNCIVLIISTAAIVG